MIVKLTREDKSLQLFQAGAVSRVLDLACCLRKYTSVLIIDKSTCNNNERERKVLELYNEGKTT
jgi:hypothetical protein